MSNNGIVKQRGWWSLAPSHVTPPPPHLAPALSSWSMCLAVSSHIHLGISTWHVYNLFLHF